MMVDMFLHLWPPAVESAALYLHKRNLFGIVHIQCLMPLVARVQHVDCDQNDAAISSHKLSTLGFVEGMLKLS